MSAADLILDHKLLGKHVTFEGNRKPFRASGVVTGAQRAYGCIETENGEVWGGIKFRIKPDDGARAFWTGVFADTDRPLNDAAIARAAGLSDGTSQ